MDELASHSTLARITNVTIKRRHQCLTVGDEKEGCCSCDIGVIQGGNPHGGLALQLEVPTAMASIPGSKVGEECWNSGLDGRLEAVAASIQLEAVVAAMLKSTSQRETLAMSSRVLDPYENPVK
jgi:hypothetical protein